MTLWDVTEIWALDNTEDFWASFTLNTLLDREALVNHLMLEYGDMKVIDNHSKTFRHRVETFFRTHKWNIDKLAESLNFYYNPIGNTNYHIQEHWDRDETIDTHKYEDEDWTEHGHTDETDINYVSAYNDAESREGSIVDTEHHRDTIDIDYSKEGTDDKSTDTNVVEDESYDGTQDEWGHRQNHTFQELIEQEREQAQFNIYKWIAKHFALECLIAIW